MKRRVMGKKAVISRVIQDDNNTNPANITGDVNGEAIRQIRAKIRRCLAKKTAEGEVTICYLKNDNSNYYYDGTSAVLNTTITDVMVYFPTFYYKYEQLGTDRFAISYSLSKVDDTYMQVKENLLGAYEAYSNRSKLYSTSSVGSTGSLSQLNFKAHAKSRGLGYQLIDYDQHKMIAWLFYAIYGNRDSQAICGSGTSDYQKTTGQTNTIGNADTTTVNGNSMSVNFLGIENCWGNKNEWIDNVVANSSTWIITDTLTGLARSFTGAKAANGWQYATKIIAGDYLDIFVKTAGGSITTGYCDGFFATSRANGAVVRSYRQNDARCGVSMADADNDPNADNINYGSRLAFRGTIKEEKNVATFKSLPILN